MVNDSETVRVPCVANGEPKYFTDWTSTVQDPLEDSSSYVYQYELADDLRYTLERNTDITEEDRFFRSGFSAIGVNPVQNKITTDLCGKEFYFFLEDTGD